ncbi:MAG: anthranilate synthase component I [candidate division FCPU426 bacterium]
MNFYPSWDEFKRRSRRGNLIPVYAELPADVETPVSAFLKIADRASRAFLLESVEGGDQVGRYSFLGADPAEWVAVRGGVVEHHVAGKVRMLPHGGNPLDVVRQLLKRYRHVATPGLPPFHGGAVGYLSYDLARYFEKLPTRNPDPLGLPDALLVFTENLLVFDHVQHVIKVVSNAHVTGDPARAYQRAVAAIRNLSRKLRQPLPRAEGKAPSLPAPRLRSNVTRAQFLDQVRKAKAYIRAGDIIQVQISRRLSAEVPVPPFSVYRALRTINPSPYMFYLRFPECELLGSSPELLLRKTGAMVATRPIAGTVRRGATATQDQRLEAKLLADPKERAEHIMLVDLGRNDVGRVSRFGSVRVPELMVIERYSHVMHIVSHVEGKLQAGQDQCDALQAAFPAGTVTGAPKIRAMEIIEELETERRGPYAGAVGYFDYSGDLDTGITIRTILYSRGTYHLQAAAGIVADSKPDREYLETENKMRALKRALELASQGWPLGAARRRKA